MLRFAPRVLALSLFVALIVTPAVSQDVPLRAPPDRPFDVRRIALDLAVDLEAKTIEGSATLDVSALRDLRSLRLDAVGHEVSRVARVAPDGGAGDAVPFTYDGEALTIQLSLKREETASVRVSYRVRDPQDGLYFFGPTADAPEVPYQVWSQGESVTNRFWFPCVDHPDERQATAMTVRVKKHLTVVSNGDLLERVEDAKAGTAVWRFEQDREHVSYLVTLVVGEFDIVKDTWRGKPLAWYVPVGRGKDADRSFGRTKDMLDFFSDKIGVEYPWPKYEQIVVEQFEAGGMENTGATTLNERTLHDERAHLDYSSEGLVAHELAHQWFGDLLTCRDWAHIWLNESFATYFDALWVEHARGVDEYELDMLDNVQGGLPAGKERPILDQRYPSPDAMFDGRAYPKGASVLHMLRRQLGEDAWWRGLKLYVARHMDQGVETNDFREALEDATGRNLTRFFFDWVERKGNPVLEVRLDRDAERGLVTITVTQTQEGEAYAFPCELSFMFGDREERHTFDVREKTERFVLPQAEAPTRFRFDPREAVILAETTVHMGRDLWLAQLKDDPTAAGRIRAARALGRDQSPPARDALLRSLAEDAFWGVRIECARALGGIGDDTARDGLLAGLGQQDPRVRTVCVQALGPRGRDAKTADALAALLGKGDPSYYVEAALVRAYAQAATDPRAVIETQLSKPSHNEIIRIAALETLASLNDPSLVKAFIDATALKNEYAVRVSAARALGVVAGLPGCAEADRLAAVEALRSMVRGANKRGRRAALDGLRALGAKGAEALPDVEACAARDPQAGIRRQAQEVVERIRAGAAPDQELARLREETRRLQEAKVQLEERLQKLEAAIQPKPGK
jgi:aminopeptidase N